MSESHGGAGSGPRVGAILLAAGQGSRFEGENKLLAPVDGEPIIRHAAATVRVSDIDEITAIVGHDADAVRGALGDLPLSVRSNPDYATGQSTSVREGVRVARKQGWDGTLFALGDMPFISPASIDTLVDRFVTSAATIIAPTYDGTRGNPVVFDQTHYETLADVTGDIGGRQLVENHPETVLLEIDDPGVVQDIDTVDDLPEYSDLHVSSSRRT